MSTKSKLSFRGYPCKHCEKLVNVNESLDGTKLQDSQKYRKHSETNTDYLSFSSDTQQSNTSERERNRNLCVRFTMFPVYLAILNVNECGRTSIVMSSYIGLLKIVQKWFHNYFYVFVNRIIITENRH